MSLALDSYVSQYMNANNLTRVEGLSELTRADFDEWREDKKNHTPIFMDHLVKLDIHRPSWSFEGGSLTKSLVIPIGNYVYKGSVITIGCGLTNIFASLFLYFYVSPGDKGLFVVASLIHFLFLGINTILNIKPDVVNVDGSVILPIYHPLITALSFVTFFAVCVTLGINLKLVKEARALALRRSKKPVWTQQCREMKN